MVFTFDRDAMLKEMAIAQEIIANKNALTILSNVLFTAGQNELIIQATDTRTSFQTKIPVDVQEEGVTTVFCDKFTGILSSLPPGEIGFKTDDSGVTVTPLSKKAKFQLRSNAPDKYPEISFDAKNEFFEISAADFKAMVSQTIFSVSDDQTRYFMNGVYFDQKDDKFILVATDGRRLSYCEKQYAAASEIPHVIVPQKILNIILKRASNEGVIKIAIDEKMIFFEFGNYQFSSILIEGQFPNYLRVIPEKQEHYFEVSKIELQEAIKRGGTFVENKLPRILFDVSPGTLTISSREDEKGNAQEQIPCEYEGEEVSLAFNNIYIDEPLKVMESERVRFEFTELMKAVTVRPEPAKDYFHIIMPMQSD
ncbi:MAG: DNA polymerase III subunit beta [Treponemataceae bacterium]|nr:MAG: DNA polymerase III subunit beta [Treponemataceae bacterium]